MHWNCHSTSVTCPHGHPPAGGPRGPKGSLGAPWGPQGPPWGPQGPLGRPLTGAPWAPWAASHGRPVGPLGPWAPWAASEQAPRGPLGPPWAPGAPNPLLWVADKFKTLPENIFLGIFWSKIGEQKVGIQALGPPRRHPGRNSEPIPGLKSQMVGWRPIWWQKGVIWGPLGFWAQPAHLNPPFRTPPFILHKPLGPLGPWDPWAASHGRHLGPWAPWAASHGRHLGPLGPLGPGPGTRARARDQGPGPGPMGPGPGSNQPLSLIHI